MLKFTKDDKVKFIDPKSDLINVLDADGWVLEGEPKAKPEAKPEAKKAKNSG